MQKNTFLAAITATCTAKSLGADSCRKTGFESAAVIKDLQLSKAHVPVLTIPRGYCAEDPATKRRFPLEDILYKKYILS